jgi:hypothetical protein
MSVYPSSIQYINPVTQSIQYKTLITNFADLGEEKRKAKWAYPKRSVTLKYSALSKDDAETLWQFYLDRQGSYGSFVFFDSTGASSNQNFTYTKEYVGTGDSTTGVFNLPAIDSSGSHVAYLNTSSQGSTRYTFTSKGGANGEDKITFSSTYIPGSSERVLYSFTGRLKIRCRFAEDIYTFENFYDRLIDQGIKLQGLLNA